MEEVKHYYGSQVFLTTIPRNIRLSEAPSHGKPIILYDLKSKGADAYIDLAHEMIANHKRNVADAAALVADESMDEPVESVAERGIEPSDA